MESAQRDLDSVPRESMSMTAMTQDVRDACIYWSEKCNEPCFTVVFPVPQERSGFGIWQQEELVI